MGSNAWFRMYHEFATDPVIQSLAFEDQRHYVVLLCLKCAGILDRAVATEQRERIILRGLGLDPVSGNEAKRRLLEVGLIDKTWQPTGWNKRQFISDTSTERVRNHRKDKQTGNVSVTELERSGNAPETETEAETETELKPSANALDNSPVGEPSPCPYVEVVKVYHETLPELRKVEILTERRKAAIRARWKNEAPSLDEWRWLFDRVKKSPFLMGRVNGSNGRPPFMADFDWILKPTNFVNIAEGKYAPAARR